jgi:hypothetical protein
MRRLLAILLAAASFAAGAQTATPTAGQILVDGVAAPVFNRAKCQTGTVRFDYLLVEKTAGAFTPGKGEITLDGASADKTGTEYPPCHYVGDGSSGVTMAPLSVAPLPNPSTLSGNVTGGTANLVAASAGFDCTSANKTVYLCAVWKDASDPPVVLAYAKGTVSLKVLIPGKPTVTSVSAGDGALYVKATTPADATTSEAASTWRAKAVARDAALDAEVHYSPSVGVSSGVGDEAKIGGLVNGVAYDVTAYAYSADDNESPASDPAGPYTPVPSADAWEVYELSGGRERGGCQAGGAGLAALACAAVLLRLRRRS